jgi:nucleoside-diphosphate-sugar epimerase
MNQPAEGHVVGPRNPSTPSNLEQSIVKKIIVTGGSGKGGRAVIRDLLEHGYEVVNIDRQAPREDLCQYICAELADYGQVMDAFFAGNQVPHHVDAIVHMAANPAPAGFPNPDILKNNTVSTYHVFEAARRLQIDNVVWASSETILGIPFDTPPAYLPLDEEVPLRPESAYALSKVMAEEMARQFCRWNPDMKIIGLRLSNIMEPHDYAAFPEFDKDPHTRKWNMWAYIDARDMAQAVRLSVEAPFTGAEIFIIANADTVMSRSSQELIEAVYPTVQLIKELDQHETLLCIDKAKRILGYEPQHTWREILSNEPEPDSSIG